MAKPNYADKETNRRCRQLENKITKVYADAQKELLKKEQDYFDRYKARWQKKYEAYLEGAYTKAQFEAWERAQFGRGKHWMNLRQQVTDRIQRANKTAAAYINGETKGIFALNYNYSAYQIEQGYESASFDLVDENTIERLIVDSPKLLPAPTKILPKSKTWNEQNLEKALTSGILQGKSITQMADTFQAVTNMNRVSAIRNARTAVTGAQNGGRQASYEKAADMGIELEKEWMCTLDSRTRPTHRMLDGERIPYKDTFWNGCEYPGDPDGRPEEVYNCRCTMVAVIPDINDGRDRKTYFEWLDEKEGADSGEE